MIIINTHTAKTTTTITRLVGFPLCFTIPSQLSLKRMTGYKGGLQTSGLDCTY